jgi:hypothetical protein
MAILLGSVTEGEKHVPPDQALESGRFSGRSGLRLGLGGKQRVALDPFETSASDANGQTVARVYARQNEAEAAPALSDLAHKQVRSKKGNVRPAQRHRAAPNQRKPAMTDLATVKGEAMTSDELDSVAGGIIIVSGLQHQFTSALERVALNPQPLPPRIFSFGH